ncbi:hypothetical protein FACS1894204_05250 [Synergistales bacterium]|nr:hypothetical protein FACS1894204_05250 [Synergistales bacterium]
MRKKYRLRYLPIFEQDLANAIDYIAVRLPQDDKTPIAPGVAYGKGRYGREFFVELDLTAQRESSAPRELLSLL